MNSPRLHRASHTMQRKKQLVLAKPQKNNSQAKQKKEKPFSKAGAIAGNYIGEMFHLPHAKAIGKWLGSGIGQIFGSGDYSVVGPTPESNVLFNSREVPKFSTTRATNIVCHREYIRDFTGASAFTNTTYRLNPGSSETFPWLSSIAENYQQYKFHGLIFEFKPLITDYITGGAPGVVIMATNYNASDAPYETKQEMENSEFAVSVKPTSNLVHGVECAVDQTSVPIKYVKSSPSDPGDSRLYDMGLFQFANQGSPSQLLGELWVSYCVEFFKPQQPSTPGGSIFSGICYRTNQGNTSPLGTNNDRSLGNIGLTATNTDITFDGIPSAYYLIDVEFQGSANAASQPTQISPGNLLEFVPKFAANNPINNYTNTSATFTTVTSTVTVSHIIAYAKCKAQVPSRVGINYGTNGLEPFAGAVTISVTQVDDSLFV